MNDELKKLNDELHALEEKLKVLPKKNWKILRIIVVCVAVPFIMPYFPMRHGSLAEQYGTRNALIICIIFTAILCPISLYLHFRKLNYEIHATKVDIEYVKKKKLELENSSL